MKQLYMSLLWASAVLLLITSVAACGGDSGSDTKTQSETASVATESTNIEEAPEQASSAALETANTITTDSGLKFTETEGSRGAQPESGDIVSVHYTGTLEDGTVFDSSHNRGEPIQFALGAGQVIPGWDEGIALMSEGSKAVLVIPPELAYGERGVGDVIPPNATLVFDVELVSVRPGAPEAPTTVDESEYIETDSGLKYYDFVVGDGPEPLPGQTVSVHYTGWLLDGKKFDSSLDRGEPFNFNIGMGQVIGGWDQGVANMKVGGKRQLVIPAELGYGDRGAGDIIPPGATLVFEVELLDVEPQ